MNLSNIIYENISDVIATANNIAEIRNYNMIWVNFWGVCCVHFARKRPEDNDFTIVKSNNSYMPIFNYRLK